jgi:outer membrane protein OmpA-like peptidoglycan-associated protein
MVSKLIPATVLGIFCTLAVRAQSQPEPLRPVPLYRVTVIDRTVSAVDYQYRNGPIHIDFRGTVLLPMAKGGATVESKTGRTEIDARFDHLRAPTRFGREYLTYVLWAITPNGHAKNLGEVLAGSSDKARLRVTTDLQSFGLIVTAEPYATVRQPSNVVVLENQPGSGTAAPTEPIQVKYQLLPRGYYTYHVPESQAADEADAVRVSPDQYQSIVEVYEAQNAVWIAQSAEAGRYAPGILAKARNLLQQARDAQTRKAGMTTTVTLARQAEQTAEDARILALRRRHENELASARERATRADALRAQAEAAALTAKTQAAADRALLQQERAAKQQAQQQAAAAAARAASAPSAASPRAAVWVAPDREPAHKKQMRLRLLEQFNAELATRDTPRGLMLTLPDSDFEGARLDPAAYERLAQVAAVLRAHPDLTVEVDGHQRFSSERAEAVRDILVDHGLPAGDVMARGLGDTRPIASNATAAGREKNRRVEIIVSGNAIGDLPLWAKSYTLLPPSQ